MSTLKAHLALQIQKYKKNKMIPSTMTPPLSLSLPLPLVEEPITILGPPHRHRCWRWQACDGVGGHHGIQALVHRRRQIWWWRPSPVNLSMTSAMSRCSSYPWGRWWGLPWSVTPSPSPAEGTRLLGRVHPWELALFAPPPAFIPFARWGRGQWRENTDRA
jgi:hypothetical protein